MSVLEVERILGGLQPVLLYAPKLAKPPFGHRNIRILFRSD